MYFISPPVAQSPDVKNSEADGDTQLQDGDNYHGDVHSSQQLLTDHRKETKI